MNHPLALDETSPVHTDFRPDQVNQIYRPKDHVHRMEVAANDDVANICGATARAALEATQEVTEVSV